MLLLLLLLVVLLLLLLPLLLLPLVLLLLLPLMGLPTRFFSGKVLEIRKASCAPGLEIHPWIHRHYTY